MAAKAIYSCAYFPNIAYISSMLFQDEIYIEQWENYIRQSYRSRCFIRGANGILPLIVPVEKGRSKTLIKDIKIDNGKSWSDHHLKSIFSAYGKAPFYEHYIEELESFFSRKHKFLYNLCLESMTLCLKILNLEMVWQPTEKFIHRYDPGINDFRNAFNGKRPEQYPGFYNPEKYFQLFGKQFAANLSVIDLIMCEGPEASSILKASYSAGVNN